MSTFAGKILAEGQLPNVKGTLYTCPAATTAYVKFICCAHASGVLTQTVTLFVKRTTSRRFCRAVLTTGEQVRAIDKDEALTLEAGDQIEGQTTTAGVVDYLITGAEES